MLSKLQKFRYLYGSIQAQPHIAPVSFQLKKYIICGMGLEPSKSM